MRRVRVPAPVRRAATNAAAVAAGAAAAVVASGVALAVLAAPPAHAPERLRLPDLVVSDSGAPVPYARSAFGAGWADVDGDCADTRAEVLARDMTGEVWDRARCRVLGGRLTDPYTGDTATVEAPGLDVDHVVSLSDAWVSGAWAWSAEQRAVFANDARNLLATAAAVNRSKGARGPDAWEPPGGGCVYVARYAAVKAAWGLTVTRGQADALTAAAGACSGP